ncbi:MOP flippase family protein [Methylophilus sp. OH31]|uniref:MOP flippase family protein n=1 Tax=Methylophilus sp. OH31 TaxID=1387312 RepID=UPI0004679A56|nr:MOP flippase family protein [Methylophilus sp. OH31]
MNLRQKTLSAARWTTFSLITRALLQFSQIAILARILTPSDFGLVALVTSIMVFLQIFADAGISNAIIHHQKISASQQSSLYWLNVGVSVILASILWLSSSWLAAWYKQPSLSTLITLAALAMLINSLGLQLRLRAQKNLNFSQLAKVDVLAALAGFAAAIICANLNFGVYSLLVGTVVTSIFSSTMSWIYLSEGWRPSASFDLQEISQFLQFGGYMIANNLATSLNAQIDVLLGSKMMSAQAIGQYSIAKNLSLNIAMVVNPIVTQIGLPVMAKAQDDLSLLKRIYLQTMLMTASINAPIYVFLTLFAPEITILYLGDQWTTSIIFMQIFPAWALLRSIGNPVGSLLMARGRADLSFKWNLVWLLITPPAVLLGSQYGVTGMSISMVLLGITGYWPNWYFLVRPLSGITFAEYALHSIKPLLISIFAVCTGYLSMGLTDTPIYRLLGGFLLSSISYLIASFYLNKKWFTTIMDFIKGK